MNLAHLASFSSAVLVAAQLVAGAFAQDSVTVAWQNSVTTLVSDSGSNSGLSAGTSAAGDGAVVALGYCTAGTAANPFTGDFVPLTGPAGANPSFTSTSIGDEGGGGAGRFSFATTFQSGSANSGQSLPSADRPLVIRFYSAATLANAVRYNDASSATTNWRWRSPAPAPGEVLVISLLDSGLVWRGGPSSAFRTTLPVTQGTLTLGKTLAKLPVAAGSDSVTVTASNAQSQWAVSTNNSWITISSPTTNTGNGSVQFSVTANPGQKRTGEILIGEEVLAVEQEGTPTDWLVVAGNYFGILDSDSPSIGNGLFTGALSKTGLLTAKFTFGGKLYSIKVQVSPTDGTATARFLRRGLSDIVLTLVFDRETQVFTGTVSDGTTTVAATTGRTIYEKTTAPIAGTYTFLLDQDLAVAPAASPRTLGYGSAKVSTSGAFSLVCTLPDGTKVTFGSKLTPGNLATLYLPLYGNKGFAVGTADFSQAPVISGSLSWFMPAFPKGKFYKDSFITDIELVGSRFTKPAAGTRVIGFASAQSNARLLVGQNALATPLSKIFTLDSTNTALIPAPNDAQLAIKFATTGFFSGSFFDTGISKKRTFNGVLLQTQKIGGGAFFGTDVSGPVNLAPNP